MKSKVPVYAGLTLIGAIILIAFGVSSQRTAASLVAEPTVCVTFSLEEQGFILCSSELDEETPPAETETPTPELTATETLVSTVEETGTSEVTLTATDLPAATLTATVTPSPTISPTAGNSTPFVSAHLCPDGAHNDPDHDQTAFHTLWDSARGCHYDHEHGTNPWTSQVASFFAPLGDLLELTGGNYVSHTNPTSMMENTHKHGGNKWNVQLTHPQGCTGFEAPSGQTYTGVNGSAIQFHAFGDPAVEFEVRIHSAMAFLRQCKTSNPNDYGYVFVNQHQDYGQFITPYQGDILPYPHAPIPAYPSQRGPYWTNGCLGQKTGPIGQPGHMGECRPSLSVAQNNDNDGTISSKVTGAGHSDTPSLFRLLWRLRDGYAVFLWSDQVHPFTYLFLCTTDGGAEYNPIGCEHNNSTTQVNEIFGIIPTAWDNLAGWDTDSRVGRITAQGFVDEAGNIDPTCTQAGGNCFPIKLVQAFTGPYGSILSGKSITTVPYLPERDIYFCNGVPCSETSPGAVPSGWIGQEN